MGKIQESNRIADERRRKLIEQLLPELKKINPNIELIKSPFVVKQGKIVSELNNFNHRYPTHIIALVNSLGHSLVAFDKSDPGNFRFIEVRFPGVSSFYYKAYKGMDHPFDTLKLLNIIFLIPKFTKDWSTLKYAAFMTMESPELRRSQWYRNESEGNKTRWDNTTLSKGLPKINGDPLPEFSKKFCAEIMK